MVTTPCPPPIRPVSSSPKPCPQPPAVIPFERVTMTNPSLETFLTPEKGKSPPKCSCQNQGRGRSEGPPRDTGGLSLPCRGDAIATEWPPACAFNCCYHPRGQGWQFRATLGGRAPCQEQGKDPGGTTLPFLITQSPSPLSFTPS